MPCEFGVHIFLNVNKAAYLIPAIRDKTSIVANFVCAFIVDLRDPDLIAINWIDPKGELILFRYGWKSRIADCHSLFNSL